VARRPDKRTSGGKLLKKTEISGQDPRNEKKNLREVKRHGVFYKRVGGRGNIMTTVWLLKSE